MSRKLSNLLSREVCGRSLVSCFSLGIVKTWRCHHVEAGERVLMCMQHMSHMSHVCSTCMQHMSQSVFELLS